MLRRYQSLAWIIVVVCTVLLIGRFTDQWRSILQPFRDTIGPPDDGYVEIDPNAWQKGQENGLFKEPKVDIITPYPTGKTKPAGSNYTRTLVVSRLKDEDTSWIEEELGDMIAAELLNTAIYTLDDPSAPLHPIQNKGHEVMAYLSYIIDFYASLPDVSIFMHAHRYAWHNNALLDNDASLMVRYLSPERVTREGYMNLRCHWNPGCPDWLRPGAMDYDEYKREQKILANSWSELFPNSRLPTVLAQPCCAQFAVSRERILSIPKEKFTSLRDWVLRTDLDDFLSGRILEYTWQYVFTSVPIHCPSMSVCYCDGYGLCFGNAEKFDYYFELEHYLTQYKKGLNATSAQPGAKDDELPGQDMSEIPTQGRSKWLENEIRRIDDDMKTRKAEAFHRGKEPKQRATEAGREWMEGDGF